MKKWMMGAIVAAIMSLAVSVLDPAPARADTEDILIWSAVGTGVAIVIVLVATYFTRDDDTLFLTEAPRDPRLQDEARVQFGPQCMKPDGTAALVCW